MEDKNKYGQFKKGHKFWLGKKRKNISKENNYNWKGGYITQNGYLYVLMPNHPKARAKKGYVALHVLIMESKIGRYLRKGELVHHINEDKLDNSPNNLRLCRSIAEHNQIHKDSQGGKNG